MIRRQSDIGKLKHVLEAIDAIGEFMKGKTERDFLNDDLLSSAVAHKLSVIGETVNNLDKELHETYMHIHWHKPSAFRSFALHRDFDIGLHRIWQTAVFDLPQFRCDMEKIMHELETN
jgi:uncharacterized protein with HEPN domain